MPRYRCPWQCWFAALGVSAIAACGATSTGVSAPIVPQPMPRESAVPGQGLEVSMAQIVSRVMARRQIVQSFESMLETREWKGREFRGTQYRMLMQPPSLVKNSVLQSTTQFMVGMEMLVDGSDKVKIKLPGLLSFVRMTVSAQDERAKSLNGYFPRQTDPSVFITAVTDPSIRLEPRSPLVFEGRVLPVLGFTRTDLPAGITSAEAAVDMQTGDVAVGRLLSGGKLVYEYRMRGIRYRAISPAEMAL